MSKKFLIIGSRNYANRRLLHEFSLKGFEAEIVMPADLLPFITDTRNDRIYRNVNGKTERIFKNSVHAIVSRIGDGLSFHAKTIEHMNRSMGIPSTATAAALLMAHDKVKTLQAFSQSKIKTPRSFAVKQKANLAFIAPKLGNYPIVAKTLTGSQGKGIFILSDPLSGKTTLDAFLNLGHEILLQQFIETSSEDEPKHDFRLVVTDGEVTAAIRRNSQRDDFRSNSSLKEDANNYSPSEAMKQLAIDCAAAVGLSVAGVDIAIEAATGEMFVYEINGNMNFKATEKYSKKNVALKIVEYAIKTANAEKPSESSDELMQLGGILKMTMGYKATTTAPPRALKNDDGIPFGIFPTDDDDNEEAESRYTFPQNVLTA